MKQTGSMSNRKRLTFSICELASYDHPDPSCWVHPPCSGALRHSQASFDLPPSLHRGGHGIFHQQPSPNTHRHARWTGWPQRWHPATLPPRIPADYLCRLQPPRLPKGFHLGWTSHASKSCPVPTLPVGSQMHRSIDKTYTKNKPTKTDQEKTRKWHIYPPTYDGFLETCNSVEISIKSTVLRDPRFFFYLFAFRRVTTWDLLGRPIFARLLFLTFWGPKKGPIFVILFCSNFHSLEALKACLEACPDVFCSNFHGLATLEFKTCIEACLQLCFILYFFWFAASSITLRSWGLPWGRPFAPAAA